MASMPCHPEALLLREGSPGVPQTELLFPGSWPMKIMFWVRATKVHFNLKDRGISFDQKKAFRMTTFYIADRSLDR
jgi:hypothetical protein